MWNSLSTPEKQSPPLTTKLSFRLWRKISIESFGFYHFLVQSKKMEPVGVQHQCSIIILNGWLLFVFVSGSERNYSLDPGPQTCLTTPHAKHASFFHSEFSWNGWQQSNTSFALAHIPKFMVGINVACERLLYLCKWWLLQTNYRFHLCRSFWYQTRKEISFWKKNESLRLKWPCICKYPCRVNKNKVFSMNGDKNQCGTT